MNTVESTTPFDVVSRWIVTVAFFGSGVLSLIHHQLFNAMASFSLALVVLLIATSVIRTPTKWRPVVEAVLFILWVVWVGR